MTGYVVRRLLASIPLLLIVTIVIFVCTRLLPGDPITIMLGEKTTPEARERAKKLYKLDRPIHEQCIAYLDRLLLHGDLGESVYRPGEPLTAGIGRRLPPTIELAAAAMLIATFMGILLGVVSAVRRNTWLDHVGMSISVFGVSIPIFWLGLILILLFGGLLPGGGNLSPSITLERPTGFVLLDTLIAGRLDAFADALRHLILPALTLATVPLALIARITRSSMLEVLESDYVRTAKAKGLPPDLVVMRHAFRNALVPVVTFIGLEFGYLLGGAVLTETVFSWPGMGTWIVDSVLKLDYMAVNAGVLVLSVIFVVTNLAVDVLYAFVDPRIRYGRTEA